MNKMTMQEAIEYIINADTFDDFAFRGDNFTPEDTFDNSWYRGDEEDEFELDGVSAIKVMAMTEECIQEAAEMAKPYGKNLFLLRGYAINAHEWANDPGECLMSEHVIVCVVGR